MTRPDLQGFDEYMNLVLDEAEEVSLKRKSRKPLGELLPAYVCRGFCVVINRATLSMFTLQAVFY